MDVIWLNRNPSIRYPYRRNLRRTLNSLIVGFQSRIRTERVFGYPRHLIVDLVNMCGLSCPICPNGRGEIPRKAAMMTIDLFTDIMRTLGPYLYTLTLTNWGEPLRHPKLLELLSIARRYPCYIGFSSNLQYLPDELLDGLIKAGPNEIGISIDGACSETYNRYRIGGDFDTAMRNLQRLVERRRELGSDRPKIRWQVLLNRYTEPETGAIEALARETGVDSLMFIPIFIDISRMFTHSPMERLQRDGDWLPSDPELSFYDPETGRLKGDPRFCSKIWDTMVIHPDGAVSPCCAVIDPSDDFGRWGDRGSFWRIWNGDNYRVSRRRMTGKTGGSGRVVCDHCLQHGVLIL